VRRHHWFMLAACVVGGAIGALGGLGEFGTGQMAAKGAAVGMGLGLWLGFIGALLGFAD
jgi:hypothetical protein